MKKQPIISLSKKSPTKLFFEKLNKLGQKFQRNKNEQSSNLAKEHRIVSSDNKNQNNNSPDLQQEEVFFEIGSLGFDKYGNLIKW